MFLNKCWGRRLVLVPGQKNDIRGVLQISQYFTKNHQPVLQLRRCGTRDFLPFTVLTNSRTIRTCSIGFTQQKIDKSSNHHVSDTAFIPSPPPPGTIKSLPHRFVDSCPPRLQPYLKLSRVHLPIGTWLLFWPCTWGLSLATGGLPELSLLALFGTGAFIMRGAGCTVNDMWDRGIDSQVKRTVERPLASGELRMRHAAGWLVLQLSAAFSILLQLNNPCFIIGVGSLGLVTIYPLMKRVTQWPQAVLGATFNVGVLMGFTAATKYSQLGYLTFPWLDPGCVSLYLAGISWTLIYDTIYAHQDRDEDATLGLGSTARRFGENTKWWLTGFSSTMLAGLISCGILHNLQWPFYAGVAGVAGHLAWQINTLDINNVKNCSDRFRSNRHLGLLIFLGIMGSGVWSSTQSENKKSSSTIVPESMPALLGNPNEIKNSLNPL